MDRAGSARIGARVLFCIGLARPVMERERLVMANQARLELERERLVMANQARLELERERLLMANQARLELEREGVFVVDMDRLVLQRERLFNKEKRFPNLARSEAKMAQKFSKNFSISLKTERERPSSG